MEYTYELNNKRGISKEVAAKYPQTSIASEIFSALVNGKSVDRFKAANVDKAVKDFKELGSRAVLGDGMAISEINALLTNVIQAPTMEELKLLSVFGTYQNVGYGDDIKREVYHQAGEAAREQAAGGDVPFAKSWKEEYPVPTFTVSGGYAVNYRDFELGNFDNEGVLLQNVRTEILNKSKLAIINRVYDAIHNASGVKYSIEFDAGLTKAGVDSVLKDMRPFGKLTVIGDYALVSQFNDISGYKGTIDNTTITGISQNILNEIAQNGTVGYYNGAVITDMPNPYDLTKFNAAGTNFEKLAPAGLGFVIPINTQSPIGIWTRGGLTSLTGTNVETGDLETRFDIALGVDVAKGQEYKIGTFYDKSLGGLD
jgi:hypothetical protein